MFRTSGYYLSDFDDLLDAESPLRINSAGHYRLLQIPSFRTIRTSGREDFHLLYMASGSAQFVFGNRQETLRAGEIAVYYPGHRQEYEYFLKDRPDIYWLHFTGNQAESYLQRAGIYDSGIVAVGSRNRYIQLFEQIIAELQLQGTHFLEIAGSALQQLLLQFSRGISQRQNLSTAYDDRTEKTLFHFHRHYQEPFSVEEWAADLGVSTCWFIRTFKEYTGDTPLSYLTKVRIRRSQELLEDPELTIAQIADLVGYPNPFYFSRQFKNLTGSAPSQYRHNLFACPPD